MLLYAVTVIVIFLFGLERGGLGGTLGALTTSLMTLVVPADEALGILLPRRCQLKPSKPVYGIMGAW